MELKKQMFGFRRRLQPISPSKKMIVTSDHEREEIYLSGVCEKDISHTSPQKSSSPIILKAAIQLVSHLHQGAQSLKQQVRLINISGNPNGAPPGNFPNKLFYKQVTRPAYAGI